MDMSKIEEVDARIEFERENRAPTDLELELITSDSEIHEY